MACHALAVLLGVLIEWFGGTTRLILDASRFAWDDPGMNHVGVLGASLVVGLALGACGGSVETSTPADASCTPLPCPYPGWDPATCACKSPGDAGMGGSGGSAGAPNGGSAGVAGSAGAGGWASCQEPYECTLVDTDCCHMECFETNLGAFAAVNTNLSQKYLDALCTPMPPCPGYMCPEEGHLAWVRSASQFGATCEQGTCKGFDIRTSPASKCSNDTDCVLRWGLGCCELCYPTSENLVAVSKNVALYDLVCGNVDVDCCQPPPVAGNAVAMCDSTGHCAVAWAL
jgi:hypothetical protein